MKKIFLILILFYSLTSFPFYFENDIDYKIYIIEKMLNFEALDTSISPYPSKEKNIYKKNSSNVYIQIPYFHTNNYELAPIFEYKNNNFGLKFNMTNSHNLILEMYFGKRINSFWFILGRYQTDWSLMEHGVFLSDSLPFVDGITGGFTTNFLLGSMGIYFGAYSFNSYLTEEEFNIQRMHIDGNSDRRSINEGYYDPYKTLMIHRLDLKPLNFVRVSINELNLIGGKLPDIVDLNFMNILHNTYGEGYSNAMFAIDGEIVPLNGIKIYGELAMDDFVVPLTESGAESYKPTALAWAYGIKSAFKKNNFYFTAKYEEYKIYSWMYNRWQELLKFTGRYIDDKIYDIPMGYDYGSGIESKLISLEFLKSNVDIKIMFEKINQGEINLNTSYFDTDLKGNTETWEGPYGDIKEYYYTTLNLDLNNLFFEVKFDKFLPIEYKINYKIIF
ncbi:hypothetical protein [Marinitoga sp. 38H-ov]|uniref:hypothetical protein n=1 Tax=Marinitoga sp. 38H-ov TaxID=1755814 RepID=UPI0013E9D0BD|nr:hypothetical protein [Marinitoga sp. 38H-ov]KAF2957052.1 hypothetical protein AS160_03460 [Marinitoga sp. 38H-ov]